jgi:hypothetical protein
MVENPSPASNILNILKIIISSRGRAGTIGLCVSF